MSLTVCPHCHLILSRSAAQEGVDRCGTCDGRFERPALDDESESVGIARSMPTETVSAGGLSCPLCLSPMKVGSPPSTYDCLNCGGRWIESESNLQDSVDAPAAAPSASPTAGGPSDFVRNLLYGVSLPERILRSGVGLTAGAAKELAGALIPQSFQSAKSYELAIEKSLTFLTETVGGVAGGNAKADKAGEHVARKAVGNFIDLAGLATLHVSPMWVLAAVSDVAYGSKSYVREVAAELKRVGVIHESSTIDHIDDVLEAIQQSSGTAASAFDTPPLSVDELRETVRQTGEALSEADLTTLIPEAELRRLWAEMHTSAHRENVGLLEISSAITLQMLNEATTVSTGALTGIRVAGGIVNRSILGHYREGIARIRNQGFYATVAEAYQPYVDAVWNNFSGERETWTEQLLNPDNLAARVEQLYGFLSGDQQNG